MDWYDAGDYVDGLNSSAYLGYTDWTLPSVDQLAGVLAGWTDGETYKTYLEKQGFTNVQSPYHDCWSSTNYVKNTSYAWRVSVSSDYVYVSGSSKTSDQNVWPVRAGSSGSLGNSDISVTFSTSTTSNYLSYFDFGSLTLYNKGELFLIVTNNGDADLVIDPVSFYGHRLLQSSA